MEKLKERLLSDKNIFLSIYLVDSYIENKELLTIHERQDLAALKDVFDKKIINNTIKKVKKRIEQVINQEDYFFEVNVYFKPKKYDDGKMIFRPLHTATLIDQIAMIAMLQVLVYDIGEGGKLIPSELGRLLPSDFYGNRVSYNGIQLFKSWQEQYQEYTSKANELLYNYSKTAEYKYEVSLDLENFFPSVNPQVLYNFILTRLPLKLNSDDRMTIKTILRKLLIFKLCNLNEKELEWYLNIDKIDFFTLQMKYQYAKGLPQGLPHTYFMANIFMILIKDKYKEIFPGEMLFYVDDSVIFTNGSQGYLDDKLFELEILNLNNNIAEIMSNYLDLNDTYVENNNIFPPDYCYNNKDFCVKVHGSDSKSVYATIADAKKNSGEMYLKGLSRETSNFNYDMYTTFSDEEIGMIRSRTNAILDAIEEEISREGKRKSPKKVYLDKLLRYKKFYKYRKTILDYKSTGSIEELKKSMIKDIYVRNNMDDLQIFFSKYNHDILATLIQFVFMRCTEEDVGVKDLIQAVNHLIKTLYGDYIQHSYLHKVYEPYLNGKPEYITYDKYIALKKAIAAKYRKIREQSNANKYNRINEDIIKCCTKDYRKLYTSLNLVKVYNYSEYVRNNTTNLERMILNALYSYIFEFEIDDSFTFAKKSRIPIQYTEVRVLALLRNRNFSIIDFVDNYKEFTQDDFQKTADYSLFQVLEVFKTFVVLPERIDKLILIHKYCCETWKNGSKYLHFYTLHNQEHAVSLIRSSIQLLHAMSYFKLKQLDFFILFAACYLHDISMVTIPEISNFYINNDERSNNIYSEFIEEVDIEDSARTKKALCDAYEKIDEYYEAEVRSNHAHNSAMEIRSFKELDFIEPTMREMIAEVSAGHGYNTEDIYYMKSVGKYALVNEKFIKILLRLSDLLDMSRYRISKVVLNHNLENLNNVSRFHWISHLITDGYNLKTVYSLKKRDDHSENDSFLKKGEIVEKIIFNIDILMSQTTEVIKKNCKNISSSLITSENKGDTIVKITCNKDSVCNNEHCNFLCKWFVTKNDYLFEELGALKCYLNSVQDNFYSTDIEVNIRVKANKDIPNDVFDYLRDYINS